MLRNNELRELTRQLNKSPRTSLLNEEEKKAAEVLKSDNQETTKEKGKVAKKKNKTNE